MRVWAICVLFIYFYFYFLNRNVGYVCNVIIVRQEIKINSDQIPKKIALFCKLPLIFALPFCVLPFSVYASLHTAFLRDTFLHAGSLRYPSLRVASLRDAFLHVGSLRYAFLRVASLSYASLHAAS